MTQGILISVYSPFSDRVGLPLHNILSPFLHSLTMSILVFQLVFCIQNSIHFFIQSSSHIPTISVVTNSNDNCDSCWSTHSLNPCLWGESDHPAVGPPPSLSLHLAGSSITTTGYAHKSRDDSVVRMWAQLKRWCVLLLFALGIGSTYV